MIQNGIPVDSSSSESELEDPGDLHGRLSPIAGPSWADPTPPPRGRKRKRSNKRTRTRSTPPRRRMVDVSTSTSDLLSGYNNVATQTGASTSTVSDTSSSSSESDFELETPTNSWEGRYLSVAEDTDAPPSHPPDGLDVQPIPGPSNWIPPGVVEGNTWSDSQWTWDTRGSPNNLVRDSPHASHTYHSLPTVLGTNQDSNLESVPDDFFDNFIDNFSEASPTDAARDQILAPTSSPSAEYCPSDCSSEKENWPEASRALTPTPPHSPSGDEEDDNEIFHMDLNLED